MKVCFKCKKRKPIEKFYVHKMMADGHLGKCKECTRRDVTRRRRECADKVWAYDRARQKLPHRRAIARAGRARYSALHPERAAIKQRTCRAIKKGLLVKQPCEHCGERKVVAHHDDYAKPLVIRWLCHPCHRRHHAGTL